MISGKMDKWCERTWPLVFYQFTNNNLELANNDP